MDRFEKDPFAPLLGLILTVAIAVVIVFGVMVVLSFTTNG